MLGKILLICLFVIYLFGMFVSIVIIAMDPEGRRPKPWLYLAWPWLWIRREDD